MTTKHELIRSQSRRNFLQVTSGAFLIGLSGCQGISNSASSSPEQQSDSTQTSTGTVPKQVREKWKIKLNSKIHQRSLIANNAVFVGLGEQDYTTPPSEASDFAGKLIRLDLETGDTQWGLSFDKPVLSTPKQDSNYLYVITGLSSTSDQQQQLWKITLDGKDIWQTNKINDQLSILAKGDNSIFLGSSSDTGGQSGSEIFAFSIDTGGIEWRTEGGATSQGTYVDHTVLTGLSSGIAAYDSRSGQQQWVKDGYSLTSATSGVPVSEALTFLGQNSEQSGDGYTLEAIRIQDGATAWNHLVKGGTPTTIAIKENDVFLTTYRGKLYNLEAKNGRENWTYTTHGDLIHSPPVISGEQVFVGDNEGTIYALKRSSGKELWRQTLDGFANEMFDLGSAIVVQADGIDISDRRIVSLLDRLSGKIQWNFKKSESLFVSPTEKGIVIATKSGTVRFVMDQ